MRISPDTIQNPDMVAGRLALSSFSHDKVATLL
jgi:hypothetical protein